MGRLKEDIQYIWNSQRLPFVIICVLASLAFCVIIVLVGLQLSVIYTDNYGFVIDAGSTGTRVFLYSWRDVKENVHDDVKEVRQCNTLRIQDIDAKNKANPLLTCINDLKKLIPIGFVFTPNIYCAATAGMRLYELDHPEETKALWDNVRTMLKSAKLNPGFVGIITGYEEALTGWITANYLHNTIGKNIPANTETIGALDLGGASTQIAFVTNEANNVINLFERNYNFYGESFLCYGTDKFSIRYVTSVQSNKSESEFNCWIKNLPVTFDDTVPSCKNDPSKSMTNADITKSTSPDPAKCRKQIKRLLPSDVGRYKIPPTAKFMAFSAYYYVYDFLRKNRNISNINFDTFDKGINDFCTTADYNVLKDQKESKYFKDYCLIGCYISVLLSEYGFTQDTFNNIQFIDKINGESVGWSLGYMIAQTKNITNAYVYRINNIAFIAVVTVCSIFVIISVWIWILICLYNRKKKISMLSA